MLKRNNTSRPEVFRREAERDAASAVTHFRFPTKPYPHSILLVFKEYDYTNFTNDQYSQLLTSGADRTGRLIGRERGEVGVSLRTERSIELPFPKQLSDTTAPIINGVQRDPFIEELTGNIRNAMDGSSTSLGDIPSMIQNLGAGAASSLSGLGSGNLASKINDIAGQIGGVGTDKAAVLAAYLGRSVLNALPGDIGRNVNTATGEIINPRETLAFEGVALRSHQFTWDLYPSNTDDSKRIQEIVSIIKRSVLPRTQGLAAGDFSIGKAFLKYPHVLETYLIGVQDGYFMQFKPAFVTNVSVNYGASGSVAMLKGGKPAGVSLSLSMQELQIETAHDYGEEALEDVGVSQGEQTTPENNSIPDISNYQFA